MRRISTVLVSLAVLAIPIQASGRPLEAHYRTAAPNPAVVEHRSAIQERYLKLYWQVVRQHGRRSPGRNIVTRGIVSHGHVRSARRGELNQSIATFELWLAPAPVVAHATTTAMSTSTSTSAATTGGYAIPSSIVMCESGGSYTAVNPSSGAYGAYQILPSTSASLGCDMATPAGQDQCAAKVWATQGRGAWVC